MLIELEKDGDKKKRLLLMKSVLNASNAIDELRLFTDEQTKIEDCEDADNLCIYIAETVSDFWKTHKRPKNTFWDK